MAIVRNANDAWNRGDLEALTEGLDPEVDWHQQFRTRVALAPGPGVASPLAAYSDVVSEGELADQMRAVTRDLNALAYERGAGVGRMSFEQIAGVAHAQRLYAWLLCDEVLDERDGGYWRVFRLSPAPQDADEGHGGVVVETAARPRLLPMFNLYRHDADAQRDGLAELRARYPAVD